MFYRSWLSLFSVLVFSNLALAETNYSCTLDAGGSQRTIRVSLREDTLQMKVELDQGQTIRAAVVETTDHASGKRFYFCDTGGASYRYEIRLTVDRDPALASLTLKRGAYAFQCVLTSSSTL